MGILQDLSRESYRTFHGNPIGPRIEILQDLSWESYRTSHRNPIGFSCESHRLFRRPKPFQYESYCSFHQAGFKQEPYRNFNCPLKTTYRSFHCPIGLFSKKCQDCAESPNQTYLYLINLPLILPKSTSGSKTKTYTIMKSLRQFAIAKLTKANKAPQKFCGLCFFSAKREFWKNERKVNIKFMSYRTVCRQPTLSL